MLTLDEGFTVPVHVHHRSDEVFLFVQGRARIETDRDAADVGPGDAMVLEPGEWHTLTITEGPMLLLAIVAPNLDDAEGADALPGR